MLLFSLESSADWLLTLQYGGFFGKYSLGVIYEGSDYHALEFSLGTYTNGHSYYGQLNAAYRFSPWQVHIEENRWTPFQLGLFTSASTDSGHYFFKSPDKYPTPGYYDETAYRWGMEFASTFALQKQNIELAYYFRVIDTGLIAIYNNAHRDLQYYLSSGLGINYRF